MAWDYPEGVTDDDINGGDSAWCKAVDDLGDAEWAAGELFDDLKKWIGEERYKLFEAHWLKERAEAIRSVGLQEG